MIRFILFPIVALLFITSCATTSTTIKESIVGKWTTDKVRVKIMTLDNTERDSTIIVSSEDFQTNLGIHSNVSHYYPDGTYKDLYYATKDSVLLETSGTWMMQGEDSLVVRQQVPSSREHIYFVRVKRDKGIFKGLVDWDGDGLNDDEFMGIATKSE